MLSVALLPLVCLQIKTYMQTHGTGMDAVGLKASAAAFLDTGKQLVARGGPGALFVGLAPRLAHQVPGECARPGLLVSEHLQ